MAKECFGEVFVNHMSATPARYDFRSRHAGELGGQSGYLAGASEVKNAIRTWVGRERRKEM